MIDKDLTEVKFGQATYAKVAGVECHIARGGYTGEDGFEVRSLIYLKHYPSNLTFLPVAPSKISIPPASAVDITSKLTASPGVSLIGLGARDSLRLEAGMCLYGHDLDESVSPIEAGLAWLVGTYSLMPKTVQGLRSD